MDELFLFLLLLLLLYPSSFVLGVRCPCEHSFDYPILLFPYQVHIPNHAFSKHCQIFAMRQTIIHPTVVTVTRIISYRNIIQVTQKVVSCRVF